MLATLDCWHFHINFRNHFPTTIFKKRSTGILIRIMLNLYFNLRRDETSTSLLIFETSSSLLTFHLLSLFKTKNGMLKPPTIIVNLFIFSFQHLLWIFCSSIIWCIDIHGLYALNLHLYDYEMSPFIPSNNLHSKVHLFYMNIATTTFLRLVPIYLPHFFLFWIY